MLGSLEVVIDGEVVPINAPKQRAVLAALLLHANQLVRTPRLIEHLWGSEAPKDAYNAVQTHITRLRRALGSSDLIRTVEGGYLIHTDGVDLQRFRELVGRARTASGQDALSLLRKATALWRGPLLPDLRDRSALDEELDKIESELLNAAESKVDLELRANRHVEVVAELRALTTSYPLRESLWEKLMLALFRSGRQAEALEAFRMATRVLNAELGVAPGQALRQLHIDILSGQIERQEAVTQAESIAIPRQLPAGAGNFTGRREVVDALLSALKADVGRCPVAVISGSPGVGKTAVAVHVAQRLASTFSSGQLHVDLHGYSSAEPPTAEQIMARFLRALGAAPEEIPAQLEGQREVLRAHLVGRRVLFLLDNAASVEQVRRVLPEVPGCCVLVTSRERLVGVVSGGLETVIRLGALEKPEAVELLGTLLRAESADSESVNDLAELCGRLPLALCIAGANILAEGVALDEYVRRLRGGDRLSILAISGDEQAEVASAFMLSYSSLGDELQSALSLLSVVPGRDFGAEVATACLGSRMPAVVPLLDRLVSANLLEAPYPGRYQFHDLIRLFSEQCLRSNVDIQERRDVELRVYGFYLLGAVRAGKMVSPEKGEHSLPGKFSSLSSVDLRSVGEASEWVTRELGNLVAVVDSARSVQLPEVCWLIPSVLRGYLYKKHRVVEWLHMCSVGLDGARRQGDQESEAAMFQGLGTALWAEGKFDAAVENLAAAVTMWAAASNQAGLQSSLMNLAIVYWDIGDLVRAAEAMEQSAALFDRSVPDPAVAPALVNLAMIYSDSGRLLDSVELYREAFEVCRLFKISWGEANVLSNWGYCSWRLGQLGLSCQLLEQARQRYVELDLGIYQILHLLGNVNVDMGLFGEADKCFKMGLSDCRDIGERKVEQDYLWGLGYLRQRMGELDEAIVWYTDALELARSLGSRSTEAGALLDMATVHAELGRPAVGLRLARQAVRVSAEGGFLTTQGSALTAFAVCCLAVGRAGSAVAFGRKALAVHRETGHRPGEARTLRVIGQALFVAGDRAGALEHWERAVEMFAEMGMPEADGVRELLGQAR
ncbi:DNA-binding transcriptional activator of the SARP family [Allokutzneria albata]|uniref:DNA-binding transcriptional activator of the SARP family n=1 Tax=Allokutzneria albata TaxID=211114 RepID=A0A1H0AWH2_ALLAB|nr:DNA-binding transcriptional activator of the SARP family [Allokutzneria albata]